MHIGSDKFEDGCTTVNGKVMSIRQMIEELIDLRMQLNKRDDVIEGLRGRRIGEVLKEISDHALENAEAVKEYSQEEGRIRELAAGMVAEAVSCLFLQETKRGDYWISKEGKEELREIFDNREDGNSVRPLLDEIDRITNDVRKYALGCFDTSYKHVGDALLEIVGKED